MAKCVEAYEDAKGRLHSSAEKATCADLAQVLGKVGEGGELTDGIAKVVLEKRAQIEGVFADHDRITQGKETT